MPYSSLNECEGASGSIPPPTDANTLQQRMIHRDENEEEACQEEGHYRREEARRKEESARFQELILHLTRQQPLNFNSLSHSTDPKGNGTASKSIARRGESPTVSGIVYAVLVDLFLPL